MLPSPPPNTHTNTIEPFGVKAGQQVSIAVINLNSNIPTFVVTEKVIQAATPGLVSLAEGIASSQDLSDKVAAFVGIASTTTAATTTTATTAAAGGDSGNETTTTATPNTTPDSELEQVPPSSPPATGQPATSPPSSSANVVGSPILSLMSWTGLLLVLPLCV
mmetsp:Transcript_22249/g.33716  ORF Transcript_22249/g.33716 Transcript_22249/m.33716 type:complete len:163 (-) Transcript_22249:824-1312(-)